MGTLDSSRYRRNSLSDVLLDRIGVRPFNHPSGWGLGSGEGLKNLKLPAASDA